jgi:hypothetical protein
MEKIEMCPSVSRLLIFGLQPLGWRREGIGKSTSILKETPMKYKRVHQKQSSTLTNPPDYQFSQAKKGTQYTLLLVI